MTTRRILLSTAVMCMLALPAAAQDTGATAGGGAAMGGPGAMPGMGAAGVDPQAMMGMMNAASNMAGMVTIGFLLSADSDHDGNITKTEWAALFDRLDPDHDGTITKAEIDTMKKEQMDKIQQMRVQMMQHMQEMQKMQGAKPPPGTGMEEPPPAPSQGGTSPQ